ncbi:hypothetical protein CTA21_16480 [Salmonella enterica]|nr:hypothetical protein [Salmonella enterica]
MKATKLIIALGLVVASISAANASDYYMSMHCPKSGDILVEARGQDLTINEGGVEFTETQPTIREVVKGKVVTIQGALLASNTAEFRAFMLDKSVDTTGLMQYIRSDRKNNETCRITEYQEFDN